MENVSIAGQKSRRLFFYNYYIFSITQSMPSTSLYRTRQTRFVPRCLRSKINLPKLPQRVTNPTHTSCTFHPEKAGLPPDFQQGSSAPFAQGQALRLGRPTPVSPEPTGTWAAAKTGDEAPTND